MRYFVATLELVHERAHWTRAACVHVCFSRCKQSRHIACAEVFVESLRIYQDRIGLAIDGQDDWTAGLMNLIEYFPSLAFQFCYGTDVICQFHVLNLAHNLVLKMSPIYKR